MVVSGAPVKENDHADRVCDMALDMVEAITDLKDRSTGKKKKISAIVLCANVELTLIKKKKIL